METSKSKWKIIEKEVEMSGNKVQLSSLLSSKTDHHHPTPGFPSAGCGSSTPLHSHGQEEAASEPTLTHDLTPALTAALTCALTPALTPALNSALTPSLSPSLTPALPPALTPTLTPPNS